MGGLIFLFLFLCLFLVHIVVKVGGPYINEAGQQVGIAQLDLVQEDRSAQQLLLDDGDDKFLGLFRG